VKEYMLEIDRISEEEDPETQDEKLTELETQLKEDFAQGKLEDLHFLMLQEIIVSKKGEIRKAEVTRKFGKLPEGILKELDEMLKDGNINREEYESFVATISKTKGLSAEEKEELSKMIGEWEDEDKESITEETISDKEKPKKPEIDKELDKEIEALENELNSDG